MPLDDSPLCRSMCFQSQFPKISPQICQLHALCRPKILLVVQNNRRTHSIFPTGQRRVVGGPEALIPNHHGVELRANLQSISHKCHLEEVAFVWEWTKETNDLPLGCLAGASLNPERCTVRGRRECGAVPTRARIQGSWIVVSLNSRLESNKREEDSKLPQPQALHRSRPKRRRGGLQGCLAH